LGNAFSFLLTEKLAKKNNAEILLRIDDSDAERKRPEYVLDIFETLDWLEIKYHKGPADPEDFEKNWSQHTRMELYREALQKLIVHKRAFACECTRRQLQAHDGRYPATCEHKNIPLGTDDTSIRLLVKPGTIVEFTDEHLGEQRIDLDEVGGSFNICRRDGLPSYHLASVVDDVHFGVTHIVRGIDLLPSTAAQLFLAEKLGGNNFYKTKFYHHILIPDEHGEKLSKSEGALSLKTMRDSGMTKADILQRLSSLLEMYH
jgi:glutamyl-tRNA synthetase